MDRRERCRGFPPLRVGRERGLRPGRQRDGLLRRVHQRRRMSEQPDLGLLRGSLDEPDEPARRPSGSLRRQHGLRRECPRSPPVRGLWGRRRAQRHLAVLGRGLDRRELPGVRPFASGRGRPHVRPGPRGERERPVRRVRTGVHHPRVHKRHVGLAGRERLDPPHDLHRSAPGRVRRVRLRPGGRVRPSVWRRGLHVHRPQRHLGAVCGPVVGRLPRLPPTGPLGFLGRLRPGALGYSGVRRAERLGQLLGRLLALLGRGVDGPLDPSLARGSRFGRDRPRWNGDDPGPHRRDE